MQGKVDIRTLMMIDSLEMTDTDRKIILDNCLNAKKTASSLRTAPTRWKKRPECWEKRCFQKQSS